MPLLVKASRGHVRARLPRGILQLSALHAQVMGGKGGDDVSRLEAYVALAAESTCTSQATVKTWWRLVPHGLVPQQQRVRCKEREKQCKTSPVATPGERCGRRAGSLRGRGGASRNAAPKAAQNSVALCTSTASPKRQSLEPPPPLRPAYALPVPIVHSWADVLYKSCISSVASGRLIKVVSNLCNHSYHFRRPGGCSGTKNQRTTCLVAFPNHDALAPQAWQEQRRTSMLLASADQAEATCYACRQEAVFGDTRVDIAIVPTRLARTKGGVFGRARQNSGMLRLCLGRSLQFRRQPNLVRFQDAIHERRRFNCWVLVQPSPPMTHFNLMSQRHVHRTPNALHRSRSGARPSLAAVVLCDREVLQGTAESQEEVHQPEMRVLLCARRGHLQHHTISQVCALVHAFALL